MHAPAGQIQRLLQQGMETKSFRRDKVEVLTSANPTSLSALSLLCAVCIVSALEGLCASCRRIALPGGST